MKVQTVAIKLGAIALISLGLNACSMLPSGKGVFIDEKENYKKAHELPELEIPPKLLKGHQKDEYDGAKAAQVVANKGAPLKTMPLNDEGSQLEFFEDGLNSRIVMRDTLRNVWRKTITALEALDYDIEDKNRATSMVYLNITKDAESESMLSGLSFWKTSEITVYLVALKQVEAGVEIRVLDEEQQHVFDAVSEDILSRLLAKIDS